LGPIVNLVKDFFQLTIFLPFAWAGVANNSDKKFNLILDLKAIGVGFLGIFSPSKATELVKKISHDPLNQFIDSAPSDAQKNIMEFSKEKLSEMGFEDIDQDID
jgi:hypothetical protein